MRQTIEVNGRLRQVSARRSDERYVVETEQREFIVDAVRVGVHTLSLLISKRRGEPAVGTEPAAAELDRTFSHEVAVLPTGALRRMSVCVGPAAVAVSFDQPFRRTGSDDRALSEGGPCRVVAPMPGRVVRLLVAPGQEVHAQQPVAVVEAMKMENELRAPREGVVLEVPVKAGQLVEIGTVLAIVGDRL